VKVLVEFEGVRDVACFEENNISCTKLHHITGINTNPNSKRAATQLGTRANTSEGNSGVEGHLRGVSFRLGWALREELAVEMGNVYKGGK
jgi:hypothetical protein